jgi:PRTRC genetic system protein C
MADTNTTPTTAQRRFVYNGMELPDPSPEGAPLSTDQVRDAYAGNYPELATARVKGPTMDGGVEVYTFVQNVGVKG